MHISHESGRYDHIHGDEDWLDAMQDQSADDILSLIAHNDSGAYDWIKLLSQTDAFYHLVIILSKGRDKPEYRELLNALKDEIKGFL